MQISMLSGILKEAGVVGAGGAGFPTYAKLSEKADTILLNCAECEPLLRLHRQLLRDKAYEIVKAFSLVKETVGAKDAIIGIKAEYEETIDAVNAVLPEFPGIRIHKLPSAYPMGDEVVLIYEATGRVVRPGGLPIECGVAVFNVETMFNTYRAVFEKKPVTKKLVTVAGEVAAPKTVFAPLGTTVKELVKLAGGLTCERPVYLMGGPMMGSFGSEATAVTKTTNAVIVLPKEHVYVSKKQVNFSIALKRAASSCCQCQTCTDLCPRHLLGHPIEPHLFMRAVTNKDTSDIKPFVDTMFCSSCGLCENFSCPQGLSPRSMMAEYKNGLRKNGVKAPTVEAAPVNGQRGYRRVPEKRLLARLGLSEYSTKAPLSEETPNAKELKVMLSQHIGAKAVPVVKSGDCVKEGDLIAKAADGLSVCIHASGDGVVETVTDSFIRIKSC